ncbi:MAG: hypothetical protein INR62_06915 [Rhodospirillales bacterium]|nr:hypothetical protein [Acetobacter sp.]
MAARILPFRTLVPSVAEPMLLSPISGPLCTLYSQSSCKVLIMSMDTRRRQHRHTTLNETGNLFHKVERELHDGYLEVEITGLTLRRLAVAYLVLARGAWTYTLGSVRSLLRPTPAV